MRKLRYAFIIIVGLFFYSMLLAAAVRNIYLSQDQGSQRFGLVKGPIKFLAETPSLIKRVLEAPEFYVSNSGSEDGVFFTSDGKADLSEDLLVSYKKDRFQQVFELIDLSTGKSIRTWEPDNKEIYDLAYNPQNPKRHEKGTDLHFMHPMMNADSSLIFNSQLTSLLVRVDKNNQIQWLKNDRVYHHSIEPTDRGTAFVCTRPFESAQYDFLPGDHDSYKSFLLDDHITEIDMSDGDLISTVSIIDILLKNGYEDLLLYKGQTISDPTHLNDIEPALYDSEYWQRGDLLISCRNLSTVFLYRPSTGKILWLRHGPWYNQHDVDFLGESKVVVFGNDVIREESVIDPRLIRGDLEFNNNRTHNEVYVYDFANDSVAKPYTELLKSESIRTATSGRSDILENGDLFAEDTNNGRIIIGDSINKKLEYVKRLDEEHISSLFWSRIVK